MVWQELVVFSKPTELTPIENKTLNKNECAQIREITQYDFPKFEVPDPSEFVDVKAKNVLEGVYEEVSPFPESPFPVPLWAQVASKLIQGQKIYQWSRLRLDGKYSDYKPFDAWRGHEGVHVQFINAKNLQIKAVPVPYCRRICGFRSSSFHQCSAFGSYSQIELSPFLPLWQDHCSAESAQDCPMRLAKTWPKPDNSDPVIADFQTWCKTRRGWLPEKGIT